MTEKPSDVLSHRPSPHFTGDTIPLSGTTLEVFEITSSHDESEAPLDIATDNPDGLSRLIQGGLEGLVPGESVTYAQKEGETIPPAVRVVKRTGNGFTISRITLNPQVVKLQREGTSSHEPPTVGFDEAKKFLSGKNSFDDYMDAWSERTDKLGETVREMGFTEESYPIPTFLRDQILILRDKGLDVPRIMLFRVGKIDGHSYVDAWSARYFPASTELNWVAHDLTQEHYFGLLPFGDDAMEFGGLYADALKDPRSMHAMVYPNQDTDKKVAHRLSGEEKVGHAADVLDIFSVELSFLASNIDNDVEKVKLDAQDPKEDLIREMATVIMESDQAEKFRKYLDDMGSSALSEDGTFSPEQFRRDLLKNAQKRWEIEPASSDAVSATSSVEY